MPLPLTVSCFSKIQISFTYLVPAHPAGPGKRSVKHVRMMSSVHVVWFVSVTKVQSGVHGSWSQISHAGTVAVWCRLGHTGQYSTVKSYSPCNFLLHRLRQRHYVWFVHICASKTKEFYDWPRAGSGAKCTIDSIFDFGTIYYCLLVYIACFPTYPFSLHFYLSYLLPYLSFPLRTDPLRFQAGSRKSRLNLALVFVFILC